MLGLQAKLREKASAETRPTPVRRSATEEEWQTYRRTFFHERRIATEEEWQAHRHKIVNELMKNRGYDVGEQDEDSKNLVSDQPPMSAMERALMAREERLNSEKGEKRTAKTQPKAIKDKDVSLGQLNAVPAHHAVNDEDFDKQANIVREKRLADRAQAISKRMAQKRVSLDVGKPVKNMSEGLKDPGHCCHGSCSQQDLIGGVTDQDWKHLSLVVDSGAAETVIPHDLATDHEIVDTNASKSGMCYASATGQPIPNMGEQVLPLMTSEGTLRGMTSQAAPVSRPLGSVMRICKSGHTVVFDETGSYIYNKTSGEVNWMREEHGNYILDLWVMPNSEMGFGGQQ